MNYFQLICILREDLKNNNNKYESIKFFRRNLTSYWLWIIILEKFFTNNMNHENYIDKIINNIPNEYSSRPTIFKIIDDGVKKKYLIKLIDKNDKRKFNIIPSQQTVSEFKEWSQLFLKL